MVAAGAHMGYACDDVACTTRTCLLVTTITATTTASHHVFLVTAFSFPRALCLFSLFYFFGPLRVLLLYNVILPHCLVPFLMNPSSHMYRSVQPHTHPCFFLLPSPVDIGHLNAFPSTQRGFRYLLFVLPSLGKQNGMSSRIDVLTRQFVCKCGCTAQLKSTGIDLSSLLIVVVNKNTERVIFSKRNEQLCVKGVLTR